MTVRISNNYEDTTNFSDTTSTLTLATSTELTVAVPGNASEPIQALFAYNSTSKVYVGYNVTAVVPGAGTVNNNQFIEYRPLKRFVKGGDVLSFITPDTDANVGVSFRSLN